MGDEVYRFVEGPEWCLMSLQLVSECQHCAEIANLPPGPSCVVTGIDRNSGMVILERGDDE